MILPQEILKKYWGFSNFRPVQEDIISAVLHQKDVIALLPTGGGKSICFQVPAVAKPGTCLVISPLIALMQDQIKNLNKIGIKATLIPTGAKQDEIVTLFDSIKFGNVKFLYISPERLQSSFIQDKIKEVNINLIAIDEAHCISEWGHDFRPSYRNIKILKSLLPTVNFIALTATANQRVLADIEENLELNTPLVFKNSFERKNLAYQIFNIENKLQRLQQIFTKTKSPAIVYVNSRKKTVEIANFLNVNNFKSSFYHAGLSPLEKQISFTDWMEEKTPIMVATTAFGMGIDKPNVGIVVHFNLPTSIENYMQETGRAGRNSAKSFAALLYNQNDILLLKEQTENTLPSISEIKEVHKKLYQNYRIASGELVEESFAFNLFEFCEKYNFSMNKTDAVLTILANNSIVEISNNYQKKSLLQFVTTHKNLLNYLSTNNTLKKFTNLLLRTYGGLFEQETKINEFILSKKTSLPSTQVIANLKRLHDDLIVNYKPTTSETKITFLVPREDDKTINRISKDIHKYTKQKKKKTSDLISFVQNNAICRNIQLLHYFDENTTKKCGICDVCISKKKNNRKNISLSIIQLLDHHKKLSSLEISTFLQADQQQVLIHLRNLLSENKLLITLQNKYQLNKQS